MANSGRSIARSSSFKPRTSRLALLNLFLLAGLAMLIVIETLMTNNQVAIGGQSSSLQQQRSQLADQVSQLSKEVSRYKSLNYINQRAVQDLHMETLQKNLWYLPQPEGLEP